MQKSSWYLLNPANYYILAPTMLLRLMSIPEKKNPNNRPDFAHVEVPPIEFSPFIDYLKRATHADSRLL